MGVYAKLNAENIVEECIVANAEFMSTVSRAIPNPSEWVEVTDVAAGADGNVSIGSKYVPAEDKWIAHQPWESWVLDDTGYDWKAPVDKPADFQDKFYLWNEEKQIWEEQT
tara:strand:+ start:303 stop:635 length:333 start_codon:yes stop_codon:yes gene_type:complete